MTEASWNTPSERGYETCAWDTWRTTEIMPQTLRLNIREVSYFEGLNVDGVDAVNAHSERNDQQQGPPVQGLWLKVKRPFLSLWTALARHGHLSPDTGTSPGLASPARLLTLFLWSRGRRWGREEGWKREIRRVKDDYLSAFLMKSSHLPLFLSTHEVWAPCH